MKIVKPPHNHYILSCLDDRTYEKYAEIYSGCKRWDVRGIYAFLSCTGLYDAAKETLRGTIVQ